MEFQTLEVSELKGSRVSSRLTSHSTCIPKQSLSFRSVLECHQMQNAQLSGNYRYEEKKQ